MPPITTAPTPQNLGVYLVQQHSRWNDVLQSLVARVTFELVTPFGKITRRVEFNAVDVVALAADIAAYAASIALQHSIPLLNGLPNPSPDYVPTNTGPFQVIPQLSEPADPSTPPVPAYAYIPPPEPPA